jgi:hypothetical protein
MNPKQLEGSILKAVSDAITRVWASEEKEFIQNDSELQNKLEQWLIEEEFRSQNSGVRINQWGIQTRH